jgi:hypothetical protein
MVEVLQRWLAAAEALAGGLPGAAVEHLASWPAAFLALVGGLALLVAGMRLGRVLAAAGAAALGWFAGAALVPNFELWTLPAATPAFAGAAVLGLLALAAPELYPVVLGLVPGGLLGAHVAVGGKHWAGAAVGAAVLALAAVLFRRVVLAATAAVAGAVLVAAALVAFAVRIPSLRQVTDRHVLLAGIAALLAVAGTAFQVGTARRPAKASAFGPRGGPGQRG